MKRSVIYKWECSLDYSDQEISPKTEPQAADTPSTWAAPLQARPSQSDQPCK